MKNIVLILIPLIALAGCQSTAPAKYDAVVQTTSEDKTGQIIANYSNKGCAFYAINTKPYKLADSSKKYVTNSFFYDPSREKYNQLDKAIYQPLITQNFKVVETGVVTAEDLTNRKPFLSKYRYFEEELDGTPYKRDKTYSTKVVTEDCIIFYLHGGTTASSIKSIIVNIDGSKITDKNIIEFIGSKPLDTYEMDASVKYDRFEKAIKISTPLYKDRLIRGAINTNDNSISYVQLYISLTFFDKWGFVSNAIDTNSNRHEVTKISTDTDCLDSDIFGCKLTETIGVTLDKQFLESHMDGFEMKVFGTREKIIKVSGTMVKGFLKGLNEGLEKSKSGEVGA